VFSTTCDPATITSIVWKWRPLNFTFNRINRESRVGGGQQSCYVWSKLPWRQRKCETVRSRVGTGNSFVVKVRGEIFTHFHALTIKVTVVCRIDYLARQEEFFVNYFLHVKDDDEHALDFSFLSRLFRSRWVWTLCVRLMLSSPNACLISAGVSVEIFTRFSHNLMLFLCRINRVIALGPIQDCK
jgi:hypothetical protein